MGERQNELRKRRRAQHSYAKDASEAGPDPR